MNRIHATTFGLSLSAFIAISYVFFVLFDLWLPNYAMHEIWQNLLPGFTWLTWPSFFLGLTEAYAYGWYIALVFSLTSYFLFFMERVITAKFR
ncbi:MAG: hypothetical protein K9G33_10975 [Sneathiella sp.]|nr:hypothetical protein [Sneathiella sp.]